MGENEQGGMLRTVVVVGLVALIAAVVIFAVTGLKSNASRQQIQTTNKVMNSVDAARFGETPEIWEDFYTTNYYFYGVDDKAKTVTLASAKDWSKVDKDLIIPAGFIKDGQKYTLTHITGWAFKDRGLTSVRFPDTIESIGAYAFTGNDIKQVRFPHGLKTVMEGSFKDNPLTEVTLPSSVEKIGSGAFDPSVKINREE